MKKNSLLIKQLLSRPELWGTVFYQIYLLIPNRWWTKPPFLPLPTKEYINFRLLTAYGSQEGSIDPQDLVDYLQWCKSQRCLSK